MTVVVVLSQTLRQKEAGQFLYSVDGEQKAVITQFQSTLDAGEFPPDTKFLSWSPDPKPPPSARTTSFLSRVKTWVSGGSSIGLRIDRWLRSTEWRLRYLDRVITVFESRRDLEWDFGNSNLNEVLESCFRDDNGGEVVVFDLFDLPAALSFAEGRPCRVTVR